MDAEYWDERYRSSDQLFSGNPNGVLVTEVGGLPPGRALDVGCGEGADARWLAGRGWRVTAIDVSAVALERAAAAAADVAERVVWEKTDPTATPPSPGAFDLVSAQYFPLPRQPDHAGLRGLLAAVAPGGALLFVGHDLDGLTPQHREEFRVADYYGHEDVARLLGPDWTVQVNEVRARTTAAPAGSHHTHDTVLRALRRR